MTNVESGNKLKGVMTGKVVSEKNNRTRIVEVQTRKSHPVYKKTYTTTKKYAVDDPQNSYHVGDNVLFVPSRPISKTKKFTIIGKA